MGSFGKLAPTYAACGHDRYSNLSDISHSTESQAHRLSRVFQYMSYENFFSGVWMRRAPQSRLWTDDHSIPLRPLSSVRHSQHASSLCTPPLPPGHSLLLCLLFATGPRPGLGHSTRVAISAPPRFPALSLGPLSSSFFSLFSLSRALPCAASRAYPHAFARARAHDCAAPPSASATSPAACGHHIRAAIASR